MRLNRMIFIHPSPDSDNQVRGLKSCTPLGYTIMGIGDLIGMLVGLLTLAAFPMYLIYKMYVGQFSWKLLLLFFVPISIGVLGRVIWEAGWTLARKKQFQYDPTSRTAWWVDAGGIKSFPPKQEARPNIGANMG